MTDRKRKTGHLYFGPTARNGVQIVPIRTHLLERLPDVTLPEELDALLTQNVDPRAFTTR